MANDTTPAAILRPKLSDLVNESQASSSQVLADWLSAPKPSDLVDEREAARILDVAPGTLSVWRSTGRYCLPFVKVGSKVRYSRAGLHAWLEGRTRANGATA